MTKSGVAHRNKNKHTFKKNFRKTKLSKQLSKKQSEKAEETYKKAPHTIVFHRGKVGKLIRQLIKDVRLVMEPYTASKLQMRKRNVLKDFVSVSSMLNISHFLSFTKSDMSVNLHIGKVPRGPTITFRVESFSLIRDVLSYIKKPTLYQSSYTTSPLLVMNNFSSNELHMKLVTSMFQHMFPSINVNNVNLRTIRRCVLLNYNSETETIDFRHYLIRVVPSGMSRAVRKLIKPKIPDLGRYADIADYITQGGNLSESEAENDGDHNQVFLPQNMPTKGNIRGSKSAIRLIEIGPRLTFKLHKIEEGFWKGAILYNSQVTKTVEDISRTEKDRQQKHIEKNERKKIQTENITRKEEAKKANKERSLAGIRKKFGLQEKKDEDKKEENMDEGGNDADVESDDDTKYYLDEVGHLPDADLHLKSSKRKMTDKEGHSSAKKQKSNDAVTKTTKQPKLSKLAMQRNKASLNVAKSSGSKNTRDRNSKIHSRDKGTDTRGKKENKFARNFKHTANIHQREKTKAKMKKGKRSFNKK